MLPMRPKTETDPLAPLTTSSADPDEVALVERCRKGDMTAFGALVRRYQDRIYNACRRLCGREADAEDFAQETFVRALRAIDRFDGRAKLYTWIFRIAINLVLSARRRDKTARTHSLDDGSASGENERPTAAARLASPEPRPEERAMSHETRQAVQAALARLEPEQRAIIVLRDLEGLDYAEIAAILETPTGTVKSRLHRARLALREELRPLLEDRAAASEG